MDEWSRDLDLNRIVTLAPTGMSHCHILSVFPQCSLTYSWILLELEFGSIPSPFPTSTRKLSKPQHKAFIILLEALVNNFIARR